MLLVPVDSSDIAAMGYDPVGLELQIQFTGRNGGGSRTYSYQPFPPDMYAAFFSAVSKGQFFAQNIKKFPSLYPYKRIDGGLNTTVPNSPGTGSLDADVVGGSQILQDIEQFEGLL